MSWFDAMTYAVGEAVARVLGWIAGRQFGMERKRAQRIGENIVIALIVGAGLMVTFYYS